MGRRGSPRRRQDLGESIGFGGDSGSTALYRDGVKVGEEQWGGDGTFTASADDAAYRLEMHAERGAVQLVHEDRCHLELPIPARRPVGTASLWTVQFTRRWMIRTPPRRGAHSPCR
jgi:hypothetical protein